MAPLAAKQEFRMYGLSHTLVESLGFCSASEDDYDRKVDVYRLSDKGVHHGYLAMYNGEHLGSWGATAQYQKVKDRISEKIQGIQKNFLSLKLDKSK